MTMITPSYLGETIEYSSLHACRSTLEDPTTIAPLAVVRAGEAEAAERVVEVRPLLVVAYGENTAKGIHALQANSTDDRDEPCWRRSQIVPLEPFVHSLQQRHVHLGRSPP